MPLPSKPKQREELANKPRVVLGCPLLWVRGISDLPSRGFEDAPQLPLGRQRIRRLRQSSPGRVMPRLTMVSMGAAAPPLGEHPGRGPLQLERVRPRRWRVPGPSLCQCSGCPAGRAEPFGGHAVRRPDRELPRLGPTDGVGPEVTDHQVGRAPAVKRERHRPASKARLALLGNALDLRPRTGRSASDPTQSFTCGCAPPGSGHSRGRRAEDRPGISRNHYIKPQDEGLHAFEVG